VINIKTKVGHNHLKMNICFNILLIFAYSMILTLGSQGWVQISTQENEFVEVSILRATMLPSMTVLNSTMIFSDQCEIIFI